MNHNIFCNSTTLTSPSSLFSSGATSKPSQYRGVYKCGKKWKSQIQINGKQEYLGIYYTETEAADAYDLRALEVGRADCLNYSKRGGLGNPAKIFHVLKKKMKHGKVLSVIQQKKKKFVEMITTQVGHPCEEDLNYLSKLFSELHQQYVERDRSTKELLSLFNQTFTSCA